MVDSELVTETLAQEDCEMEGVEHGVGVLVLHCVVVKVALALGLTAADGECEGEAEVDGSLNTVPKALKDVEVLGEDESEPLTETLAQADCEVDSEEHGVGVHVPHRVVLRLALPLLLELEVAHALYEADAV